MKYLPKIVGFFLLSFPFLIFSNESLTKAKMCTDIDIIKHTFEVRYAPKNWKKTYFKWDLDEAAAHAKAEVNATELISTKKFQQIVKRFLNSTNDKHVQVQFYSTESSFLPFTVKGVNEKYFIDWVNTDAISVTSFLIQVGDELLEFNGRSINEVIVDLKKEAGVDLKCPTEQSLAEMRLTSRSGMRGEDIPKGSVTVKIKSMEDDSIRMYQLMWDHQPELIRNPADDYTLAIKPLLDLFGEKREKRRDINMLSPLHSLYASPFDKKAKGLGSYKSYVPELGPIQWEPTETLNFHAYIYENEVGRQIGYIRIPHYVGDEEDLFAFGMIIHKFQQMTDALVIDQVQNPGGRVFYHYALASMLTDYPLITPKHAMRLTYEDIFSAYEDLGALLFVKSNDDAKELFPDDPYMNYEYALFLKEFYRFIINEWNEGRILTRPTYLGGVDHINPNGQYRYTKPILLLIDELDLSCADFFPAIMQDNKRATLFGTKTGGAGGCVGRTKFANNYGILNFSFTYTLAERTNFQLIENLGVSPDIEYALTEEDLKHGYQSYSKAINQAISELIEKSQNK